MFSIVIDKHLSIIFLHPRFRSDFHTLLKCNKRQFSKWFSWPSNSNSLSYFDSLIKDGLYDYSRGIAVHCGIKYDQQIIGYIGLSNINDELAKAELRFLMAPEYEGRGIMQNVCIKILEYAFIFLNLEMLEISIPTEDIASRKLSETLGFELEGILKCADIINGNMIDHARYGLLKEIYLASLR